MVEAVKGALHAAQVDRRPNLAEPDSFSKRHDFIPIVVLAENRTVIDLGNHTHLRPPFPSRRKQKSPRNATQADVAVDNASGAPNNVPIHLYIKRKE